MEYVAAVAVAAGVLLYFVGKWVGRGSGEPESPADGEEPESAPSDIYEIAGRLEDFFIASAHPKDLCDNHADFEAGVRRLREPGVAIDTLVNYVTGDNAIISCLAIETLVGRPDGAAARGAVRGCIG